MKLYKLKYLLFLLLVVYIPQWTQVNLIISGIGKNKPPVTTVIDTKISDLVQDKTAVDIKTINISESELLFGMMIGIPGRPELVLSRKLYETFSETELEYVLLHEAGHYKLSHSIKEIVLAIFLLLLGITLLRRFSSKPKGFLYALFLGLLFGIVLIQYGKISEIEADSYTLERISDPQGMIQATEKFKKIADQGGTKPFLVKFLFERKNPYQNRVLMAEEELRKRE